MLWAADASKIDRVAAGADFLFTDFAGEFLEYGIA